MFHHKQKKSLIKNDECIELLIVCNKVHIYNV